jgi:putative ABC transport system permease protein
MLTSLGIVIGSFTIIMVVGIGKAGRDSIAEQYKRLSVETITISRSNTRTRGAGSNTVLTKEQIMAMPEELEHVKNVGMSVTSSASVAYQDKTQNMNVQGITESYAEITHLDTGSGEMFTDDDGTTKNRVAVLGYNAAAYLFGGGEGEDNTDAQTNNFEDFIGETVKIKGLSFKVTGVLQRIGGSGGMSSGAGGMESSSSPDDAVYIPYDTAISYATGSAVNSPGGMMAARSAGSANVSYVAIADNIDNVNLAVDEIKNYIAGITGSETAYNVTDAGSTLSSALETTGTMSGLLTAVAAIVLIVSGIGIMNVLMVSVKERVKEIGILKSIGATRFVILSEFLFEAVMISVAGGLLGAGLSVFAPYLLNYFGIDFSPSLNGLVTGVAFAAATGIFFGYYPAWQAAKLKPSDALNSE